MRTYPRLRLWCAALVFAVAPAALAAQADEAPLKVGVIDLDAAAFGSPAGQELAQQLTDFQQQLATELEARQEAVRAIEQRIADRRANRAASYARRFAAKEACSKALGTGFRRGVYWRDLGVVNLPSGKPTMALTGGARARLDELTPPGMTSRIDLSLTDDHPLAQAIVIISAVQAPDS